ncbi:hypothetical protein N7475_006032 [Penicillium sp. IBT 31633x]|nr:hypothetical protein N7475_006032 [Penicillium sp. IBT 31633x]
MNPASPWIAALAEQCLSFYLGRNNQDEIHVEDVDGCLRFSDRKATLKAAIVVSWGQGHDSHRATFTDSSNQIDAVISADSPDAQYETSPCPPSIKGGPRHLVEFSDIQLVFTYSTPSPDFYLHVNRFQIHHNAVSKGDKPKPKLRKAPGLKALMAMAYEKGRRNQDHVGSRSQTDVGLTNSFTSQQDRFMQSKIHSENSTASQSLFSQIPSNIYHGTTKNSSMTSRIAIGGSSELLGFLAPSRPISAKDSVTTELQEPNGRSLGENKNRRPPLSNAGTLSALQEPAKSPTPNGCSFQDSPINIADATRISNSATNPLHANLSQGIDNSTTEIESQVVQPLNKLEDHIRAQKVARGHNNQLSRKRCHGSTDAPSHTAHNNDVGSGGPESPDHTLPSKKRQCLDAREAGAEAVRVGPAPALAEVQIVSTKSDHVRQFTKDPWEGMTIIPLSEVDIPKDQADLLEDLKWIPQEPGVSAPLCHVPPNLLTQWNKIARRRQHSAEEEEHVSECAPTPTPQDTYSSDSEEFSWAPTSPGSPGRNALPRDTVSPPRHTKDNREFSTPRGTQYSVYQNSNNGDLVVLMGNGSHSASPQPGRQNIVRSEGDLIPAAQQCPELAGTVTRNPKNSDPLIRDSNDSASPKQKPSLSPDVANEGQPQKSIKYHPHDEISLENLHNEIHRESSGDESDDAEMETFVPFALGGTFPSSSQPEPQISSSSSSLPTFAGAKIQVVETSAVNPMRQNLGKQSKQKSGFHPPSSQQPSSQAAKTSSSSRILNTYRTQDNHRSGTLSQEAPNQPLSPSEEESLRVDVLGTQTQTSSIHAPSQITVQSSSDVILDSSRPAQRQRGSSIFHLDPSDNPSSFPYASSHSLSMSELNDRSQDSSNVLFTLDGGSQLPELSPRDFTAWVASHADSPSRNPRSPRREGIDIHQKAFDRPNVELVARRQGFIEKSDKSAEAQTIYEKFCNDYSPYCGDFAHFIEMCSKLQAMRQRGQLQRSFLWDDFIIQNLEEYPRHFAERTSQDSKTLDYEEFFCANFSRPQHKKRSLTAHGLEVAASQFVPPTNARLSNLPASHQTATQGDMARNETIQSEVGNVSFTASLVGKMSNLRAQSAGEVDVANVPISDVNMHAATQSSSSRSASPDTDSNAVEIKEEATNSSDELDISQASMGTNDQNPVLPEEDEDMVDASIVDSVHTAPNSNGGDIAGVDEIDETQEADHTHHKTASVELGDDSDHHHSSASPAASPAPPAALGALKNIEPEPPKQRRSWFRSLQNIFPTGPVWSDDPNTPFKRWARQDQNLLQEIQRRGGARVPVDEKGVICRPTHFQAKSAGSKRS